MKGLVLDYQLTLDAILRRAEQLFPRKEIITYLPGRAFHRCTYADLGRRARSLAAALQARGYGDGTRVATLCWNHYQHLEVYFGAPLAGAVVHTLNVRLHPNDLAYIATQADDRLLVVDQSLLPVYRSFSDRVRFDEVFVVGDAPRGTRPYEELVEEGAGAAPVEPVLNENDAAALCYTSGTTGQPKGVLYSHRALTLHALACALPHSIGPAEEDVVLPVVPMFHANAWGYPHASTLVGATQVLPGPLLDPDNLLDMLATQGVTLTAAVPTVWLGVLQLLDAHPGRWDLSALRRIIVGGSAAPRSLLEGLETRHELRAVHAWGMTEMTPLGSVCELTSELQRDPPSERLGRRAKQGQPVPFVEVRARGESGLVSWDGKAMGELEVRGPWVACGYYGRDEGDGRWTADGWFRTGDIVTIDEHGYIEIQDRAKDLVKSGGEWISTVFLESALMEHPSVAEATVIAIPDDHWGERPLACIVLLPGATTTAHDLRTFLAARFAKWWLPERIEFLDEIPKTAVGKFNKADLRQRFSESKSQQPAAIEARRD